MTSAQGSCGSTFRVGAWVELPPNKRTGGCAGVVLSLGPLRQTGQKKGEPKLVEVLTVSVLHLSLKTPELKVFDRVQLQCDKLRPFRGTPTCRGADLEHRFLEAMARAAEAEEVHFTASCTASGDVVSEPAAVSPEAETSTAPATGRIVSPRVPVSTRPCLLLGASPEADTSTASATERAACLPHSSIDETVLPHPEVQTSNRAPLADKPLDEANLAESVLLPPTEQNAESWVRSRRQRLEEELDWLGNMEVDERRKRLQALQLELHPDKQPLHLRAHANELFLLVRDAVDRWAVPTPRKRKFSPSCTSDTSPHKQPRSWIGDSKGECKIACRVYARFFQGCKARVLRGRIRKPQGFTIVQNEYHSGVEIASFGLSNNFRFQPGHVQRCYTKDVHKGKASLVLEIKLLTFFVELSDAVPEELEQLLQMCHGTAVVSG